jgi:hypothetical protein
MKMRMSKKLLLIVLLAGVAAGIAYFISGLFYVPQLSQFEVTGELATTRYGVGEEITVEPFLTYSGTRRVTICSGIPLLFVDVYNAEGTRILETPSMRIDICRSRTLRAGVPYCDPDEKEPLPYFIMVGSFPFQYSPHLDLGLRAYGPYPYKFSLEQAGNYYVVVRAEFWLDKDDPASDSRVCSEPIWLQITG